MAEALDEALNEQLGPDLAGLARARAAALVSIADVTALPSPVRTRRAFRLEFADGSRLKGRRLKSVAQADRVQRLRPALGKGYPEIVAARGDALLLEWVEGSALDPGHPQDLGLVRRCGAMLGALHAAPVPTGSDAEVEGPEALLARFDRNIGELCQAGLLDTALARDARAAAVSQQPVHADCGLIHKDFCAENLVVDAAGAPVCIDNASLAVGAYDLDLARTWYRWPMDAAARDAFESGYCEYRCADAFRAHFAFWAIVVLVGSAASRTRSQVGRADEPLARLRALLRGTRAARPGVGLSAAPTGAGAATCLRYGDFAVAVRAPEPDDLHWLTDFLACGFSPAPEATPDVAVELVIDAAAHGRLSAAGSGPDVLRAEGFAKDTNPQQLDRWRDPDGARTFRDASGGCFYRLRDDGAYVTILARERTRSCRSNLMRAVRELAMEHVVASGASLLHASAIARGGDVIAFSGPRRSGKTTLLLAMLLGTDADYVANDRSVLRFEAGRATLRGLPTLVSIRPDTLDFFPGAQARRDAVRRVVPPGGHTRSLTPPEFLRVAGDCVSVPEGRLRALVFPRIATDASGLELRRLSPEEALDQFHRGVFRANLEDPLGRVFAARPRPRDPDDPVPAQIAAQVPAFACVLGGGAPPDPAACRELLDRLFRETESR